MASKNYKQELEGLKSGLKQLNRIIRETEYKSIMERAMRAREIQLERIQWFAKGYHLKDREEKAQEHLL